jgi:hypothetical protein
LGSQAPKSISNESAKKLVKIVFIDIECFKFTF